MARKLYAYVRKSQEGTPMAKLIRSKEGKKIEAANNAGPRSTHLSNKDIKPRSAKWNATTKKGTSAKALHKFLKTHEVSNKVARGKLKDQHTISFAADPKRK